MSYDGRNHRSYHPYHRDQSGGQYGGRPNARPDDRRGNQYGGNYAGASGSRHGNNSYPNNTNGRPDQFHQHSQRFQSPPDRGFYSNSSPHACNQFYDAGRRMNPPFHHPSHHQSFPPNHFSNAADKIASRHSTGSYDSRFNNRPTDSQQHNFRRESDPVPYSSNDRINSYPVPQNNDLQSRTLRLTDFHPNVTKELLKELFMQVAPVRNVVLRPDHAFIEFQDEDSVAYALAAMDGIHMFGRLIRMEPKINEKKAYRYMEQLKLFESQPELFGIVHQ